MLLSFYFLHNLISSLIIVCPSLCPQRLDVMRGGKSRITCAPLFRYSYRLFRRTPSLGESAEDGL